MPIFIPARALTGWYANIKAAKKDTNSPSVIAPCILLYPAKKTTIAMAIAEIISMIGPAPNLVCSTFLIALNLSSIIMLILFNSSSSFWYIFINQDPLIISLKNFINLSEASRLIWTFLPIFFPRFFEEKAAIGIIIIASKLNCQSW